MSFDKDNTFARIIEDHLELKRRNSQLNGNMPIDRYRVQDPFVNHPLFKTEEQARLEETMDGDEPAVPIEVAALRWPGEDSVEHVTVESNGAREDTSLWSKSRDFDWGD